MDLDKSQKIFSHLVLTLGHIYYIIYYTTKAVLGPITNINQSDCFISGPTRANIFPVSDRVLSRLIPRDSAQDFCLLNQDDGKYERYFL